MLKADVQVGETYLFIGSDNAKRQYLTGQPFKVERADKVFRKISWNHSKRSVKSLRFFNADGIGARAEELEPYPGISSQDWELINVEPTSPGIYTVQTYKGSIMRSEFVEWAGWAFDIEHDENGADFVVRWLREKMKACDKCHQMQPITYFENPGAPICLKCNSKPIEF